MTSWAADQLDMEPLAETLVLSEVGAQAQLWPQPAFRGDRVMDSSQGSQWQGAQTSTPCKAWVL